MCLCVYMYAIMCVRVGGLHVGEFMRVMCVCVYVCASEWVCPCVGVFLWV